MEGERVRRAARCGPRGNDERETTMEISRLKVGDRVKLRPAPGKFDGASTTGRVRKVVGDIAHVLCDDAITRYPDAYYVLAIVS